MLLDELVDTLDQQRVRFGFGCGPSGAVEARARQVYGAADAAEKPRVELRLLVGHLAHSRATALRLLKYVDVHHKVAYLLLEPLDLAVLHLLLIKAGGCVRHSQHLKGTVPSTARSLPQ
jgi:hypothetical protein